MTKETNVMALSVLMNEAMELAQGKASEAAVMLIDAAISIAVSTLGASARDLSGDLAQYIVDQTIYATGGADNA